MKRWRVIIDETRDGYQNMALDEAIMTAHRSGEVPPTLRFYRWQPPALSLGYFQNLKEEVDLSACRDKGVDVVRRLTGGRAILHDDELTYSLTVNESLDILADSVVESYHQISRALVAGLKRLDIPVELKAREKDKKAPRGRSSACFDAPSWYEVVVDGKKLIGSAQTRKKGTILQHGSLPFSSDSDMIFSLFSFDSEREREKMRRYYSLKSTTLEESAEEKITWQELTEALSRGIAEVFSVELEMDGLTPREKELAGRLRKEKYSSEEWNAKR